MALLRLKKTPHKQKSQQPPPTKQQKSKGFTFSPKAKKHKPKSQAPAQTAPFIETKVDSPASFFLLSHHLRTQCSACSSISTSTQKCSSCGREDTLSSEPTIYNIGKCDLKAGSIILAPTTGGKHRVQTSLDPGFFQVLIFCTKKTIRKMMSGFGDSKGLALGWARFHQKHLSKLKLQEDKHRLQIARLQKLQDATYAEMRIGILHGTAEALSPTHKATTKTLSKKKPILTIENLRMLLKSPNTPPEAKEQIRSILKGIKL